MSDISEKNLEKIRDLAYELAGKLHQTFIEYINGMPSDLEDLVVLNSVNNGVMKFAAVALSKSFLVNSNDHVDLIESFKINLGNELNAMLQKMLEHMEKERGQKVGLQTATEN